LLNVHVPEPWNGGVKSRGNRKRLRATSSAKEKIRADGVIFGCSSRGIDKDVEPDTDYAAIFSGAVSITPLTSTPRTRIAQ